ncbi:MAG: glycosyltransferase [Sedimentisphaerales bacterium]|nr:glycosyltransferase [Sedimentisphaerales bacterium]
MFGKLQNYIKEIYVIRTIKRSGLFDKEYYLKNNLDIAKSCMNPIKHYVCQGWNEGTNPSKYFNTKWYLKKYPDVKKLNINPFFHYIKYGIKEHRKPSVNYSHHDYCGNRFVSEHTIDKIPLDLLSHVQYPLNSRYKDKKVTIVIPIYNAYECLEKLLESIYLNSDISFEIIAIDDKSTDTRIIPLIQKYSQQHKNFSVLYNKENLGFVKSVNRGIKNAENTDVLIINSDVEVPSNWLSRMFHPIWSMEKIASVTPISNSATIMSFPKTSYNNLFGRMSLQEIDDEFQKLNPDSDIYIETPTGHGFCMAMSKTSIDQLGLFDELAFGKGYGEENDWCQRAQSQGFKNLITTNLYVYHKETASFEHASKNDYIRKNLKVIQNRYPDYPAKVNATANNRDYNKIRNLLLFLIISHDAKETILRFDSDLKGGSFNVAQDEIMNTINTVANITLRYLPDKKCFSLTIVYKEYKAEFSLTDITELESFLTYIKVDRIIINQLVGYDLQVILPRITMISKKYALSIEFITHDFFLLCPDFNLMYMGKKFCVNDKSLKCEYCYNHNHVIKRFKKALLSKKEWQAMWRTFLLNTTSIIVFSEFTKSIIVKNYPELSDKIVERPINVNYLRKVNIKKTRNINIAIIGGINYHKGSQIVWEMHKLIRNSQNYKNIKLFLFGETDNFLLRESKIYKGLYSRGQLPELMEKNHINLIFIPSIWGETFCITAQEAIEMDIPVAVFNIGAVPKRVCNYNKGLVIDKIDSKYALNSIIQFVTEFNENI